VKALFLELQCGGFGKRIRHAVCRLAAGSGNRYDTRMKLDRGVVRKSKLQRHEDDNYVAGTISERVLMVWPMTREIAALSPKYDVERRLQRDVVRIKRRGR
jgi:hypothetical protein